MKNFIFGIGLLLTVNVFANIEYDPSQSSRPSDKAIESNRSCFRELETQGCGDPADHEHFRACMNNSFAGLTESCQALMTKLYK